MVSTWMLSAKNTPAPLKNSSNMYAWSIAMITKPYWTPFVPTVSGSIASIAAIEAINAPPPPSNLGEGELTSLPAEVQPSPADHDHSHTARLQLLEVAEHQQSDEIIALESQHKQFAREHRDCIRQLRDLSEDMEQLRLAFQTKAAEYEAIVNENNRLVLEMNRISQERAEKVAILDETRQQIQSLQVVNICAYENGTIEPFDGNCTTPLDETGNERIYSQLLDREECEALRLKDVRVLSKVLAIAKNASVNIEPIFENDALEASFQALINVI